MNSLLLVLSLHRDGNSTALGTRLGPSDVSVCWQPSDADYVASIVLGPEDEQRIAQLAAGQTVVGVCMHELMGSRCCTACCLGCRHNLALLPWSLDNKHRVALFSQAGDDSNLDNCVLCGLGGNLICCDGCPAAVHLRCIGETAKSLPDGEWLCAECRMGSRGEH